MTVDSSRVQGRRQLRSTSYDELLADARSLASCPTRQLGNWSLGQICEHLAQGIGVALDGPPFKPSWFVRTLGPLLKKRYISRPMPPGFKLPRKAGRLIPAPTDAAQGLAALENAIARLERTDERLPHFVFGPMTRDEWDQLNFRHAEMHLSFIVPV
jgi:hypothetical protein